jgi:UDP-glucose 4-epimerase
MKVLVTGGAGYIGSHTIIEILENTNWEVISIDSYANSSVETYDRIKNITGKVVKHYDVDLRDIQSTEKVFNENPDIKGVIHFAAFKAVGESVEKPLLYYDNNLNSLKSILLCQEKFNVPHLIFSSSCSVYGNIKDLPVTEFSDVRNVESPYAYTKVVGEKMISDFFIQKDKLSAISLRYFNPVGAHSSGLNGELPINKPNNLVPFITQTAIGKHKELIIFGNDYETKDGTCIRDYIHVSDIANAHILALQYLVKNKEAVSHDVINIGSGIGSTVIEIIDAFEKTNGLKLNYKIGNKREGDIESVYANNDKAKKLLDWKPKRTLEEMMSSAWKWEQNLKKEK